MRRLRVSRGCGPRHRDRYARRRHAFPAGHACARARASLPGRQPQRPRGDGRASAVVHARAQPARRIRALGRRFRGRFHGPGRPRGHRVDRRRYGARSAGVDRDGARQRGARCAAVARSGAEPGQAIYVTGTLGRAAAGLALLGRLRAGYPNLRHSRIVSVSAAARARGSRRCPHRVRDDRRVGRLARRP